MVDVIIRQATRADMVQIRALIREEGWNRTAEYVDWIYDHFPQGYFVAETPDGEIVANCGANPCEGSTSLGTLSLYVTKPSHRGRGIGRQVFEKAQASVRDRNVFILAAWGVQEFYRRAGYKVSSFRLDQFRCPMSLVNTELINSYKSPIKLIKLDKTKQTVEMLSLYDKTINPFPRPHEIEACLSRSYDMFAAVDGEGAVIGWGAVSTGSLRHCLAPVYADTPETAKALIFALVSKVPQTETIEVNFATDNKEAREIFNEMCISTKGECVPYLRMYSKYEVDLPLCKVYSILNYNTVLL